MSLPVESATSPGLPVPAGSRPNPSLRKHKTSEKTVPTNKTPTSRAKRNGAKETLCNFCSRFQSARQVNDARLPHLRTLILLTAMSSTLSKNVAPRLFPRVTATALVAPCRCCRALPLLYPCACRTSCSTPPHACRHTKTGTSCTNLRFNGRTPLVVHDGRYVNARFLRSECSLKRTPQDRPLSLSQEPTLFSVRYITTPPTFTASTLSLAMNFLDAIGISPKILATVRSAPPTALLIFFGVSVVGKDAPGVRFQG